MDDFLLFSKNRRIAFICFSKSFGGLELSILKLSGELNRRSAECIIVVPPGSPLANKSADYHIKAELLMPKWKYLDLFAAMRLSEILKSNKIDIAIFMQSGDINIGAIAQFLNRPVKLLFFQEMQSGINKRDFFHSWMYSKLSCWFTLTEKMKQDAINNTRVPAEKIIPMPIGADLRIFDPRLYDRNNARDQFGIPPSKFVIGMLGRLDPQKGQEEFISSIPLLVKEKSDLHFIIAGDETRGLEGYKAQLTGLAATLGITQYLQFIPFTEKVPEFFSAIDMFVLPSHSETFGFVLVEAIAMGIPVVATASGGVTEIITDGISGLLVPPRETASLSNAILRLIKDNGLRSSLSSAGRADALKRFDLQHTANRMVQVLDALF